MEVQAALGSDIALVFDECTPFHGGREYTARSTERTHRWLDRCLAWHERARPRGPDRLRDRPGRGGGGPARARRPRRSPRGRSAGSRSAARSASTRTRCSRSSTGRSTSSTRRARATCSGIGEVDDLVRGVELGIDTFDCAMPTRIGRHGMAVVPDPGQALARRPRQGALPRGRRAAARRLPVPGLRARLLARLPALPAQGARADRPAAAHDPQPRLPAAADGRAAGRDRRRAPRRGRGRGVRRRRAVGAVSAEGFKAFEAAGWSRRAGTFAALMARATAAAVEPLLDAAGVEPGTRVLDVGSGLGGLAAAAAARGALVTGFRSRGGHGRRRAPAPPGASSSCPPTWRRCRSPTRRSTPRSPPSSSTTCRTPERAAAELIRRPRGRVALRAWGAAGSTWRCSVCRAPAPRPGSTTAVRTGRARSGSPTPASSPGC